MLGLKPFSEEEETRSLSTHMKERSHKDITRKREGPH